MFGGNVVIAGEQSKEAMSALQAWTEAGKTNDAKIFMQISHAGRQTPKPINPHPWAPSEVKLDLLKNFGAPKTLTEEKIQDYIARFANACKVAREAGFDGVQIHAAHGYLISEFLSPITNKRDDQWGGSLENRARFLLEVIKACRQSVGDDYPITTKLNSADFQRGGLTDHEALQVAQWLDESGIDMLEISGGNYESPSMMNLDSDKSIERKPSTIAREAYFLSYTEAIRKVTSMPLLVTGGFRTLQGMNDALASGALDMIGMARPLCVDPDYANKLLTNPPLEKSPEFRDLRLGPGKLLGPDSPIYIIRMINQLGPTGWCFYQLFEMGDGKEPDLNASMFKTFVAVNSSDYKAAKNLVNKAS